MMQNNLSKLIRIARIIGDLFIFTLRFLLKFYMFYDQFIFQNF